MFLVLNSLTYSDKDCIDDGNLIKLQATGGFWRGSYFEEVELFLSVGIVVVNVVGVVDVVVFLGFLNRKVSDKLNRLTSDAIV